MRLLQSRANSTRSPISGNTCGSVGRRRLPRRESMAVVVELTGSEFLLGCNVGVLRRYSALMRGRRENFDEGMTWTGEINGAIGELSAAKHLDVFWSGTVGQIDRADVGRYQVRSKQKAKDWHLVRPKDKDEDVFIGVLVEGLRCTLTGWVYGWEAKQERFWRQEYGAFFVPDDELRPIESLPPLKRN